MSRQYCATCQVSKVTRVRSLSEYQFGPYICYFDYISVHFFFNFQFHPLQIEIKFNFYINFIVIFLLNILIILILCKFLFYIKLYLYFVLKF